MTTREVSSRCAILIEEASHLQILQFWQEYFTTEAGKTRESNLDLLLVLRVSVVSFLVVAMERHVAHSLLLGPQILRFSSPSTLFTGLYSISGISIVMTAIWNGNCGEGGGNAPGRKFRCGDTLTTGAATNHGSEELVWMTK